MFFRQRWPQELLGGSLAVSQPVIERTAFARAGLVGNPSDGYFGRTISVALRNFSARVVLEESSALRIEPDERDLDVFQSVEDLAESVGRQGYYGGARLVKASIKVFHDYCRQRGIAVGKRNFTVRYQSSIPRQVGLAGSSAIVTAMLRALMAYYEVEVRRELQPGLILSAEVDELGITAGLQDRVAQVYEGCVYMDFSRELVRDRGYGRYEALDPSLLPRLYVAYQTRPAKVSGRALDDLRVRWEQGDVEVLDLLTRIASLADEGREAILARDYARLSRLMNANFDLRRRIMAVSESDLAMVDTARNLGASAKLTGSGGAIVGICEDETVRERIARELGALGARVIEPEVH
jgi:glucuronokinase